MYLGFWLFSASKPASLLEVNQKCASEVSKSGFALRGDWARCKRSPILVLQRSSPTAFEPFWRSADTV